MPIEQGLAAQRQIGTRARFPVPERIVARVGAQRGWQRRNAIGGGGRPVERMACQGAGQQRQRLVGLSRPGIFETAKEQQVDAQPPMRRLVRGRGGIIIGANVGINRGYIGGGIAPECGRRCRDPLKQPCRGLRQLRAGVQRPYAGSQPVQCEGIAVTQVNGVDLLDQEDVAGSLPLVENIGARKKPTRSPWWELCGPSWSVQVARPTVWPIKCQENAVP